MASLNLPFPLLKSTGDDKHDIEVYVEDLVDYSVMNNWYDSSKQTDEEKWIKPDKVMACLRASLSKSARTVLKYSLSLSEESQKKPHCVIQALKQYYGASIGVSGERQKFLRLIQQEGEGIGAWESRIRNQAAQCEYENFEDELMRDQFIAGLASEQLRVKLIGKGHRHRDGEQSKVSLREVVEIAKSFEATTVTNKLMKDARDSQQEQVNYSYKQQKKSVDHDRRGFVTPQQTWQQGRVVGAVANIDNRDNSFAQLLEENVINVEFWDIFLECVEVVRVIKYNTKKLIKFKKSQRTNCLP